MSKIHPGSIVNLNDMSFRKAIAHVEKLRKELDRRLKADGESLSALSNPRDTCYQSYLRDFPNSNLKPYIK